MCQYRTGRRRWEYRTAQGAKSKAFAVQIVPGKGELELNGHLGGVDADAVVGVVEPLQQLLLPSSTRKTCPGTALQYHTACPGTTLQYHTACPGTPLQYQTAHFCTTPVPNFHTPPRYHHQQRLVHAVPKSVPRMA
eukprot:2635331-Rhodomonas_salina.1